MSWKVPEYKKTFGIRLLLYSVNCRDSHLEPDDHRGSLGTLGRGEEPEEHVAIVRRVHSQQPGVALNRRVKALMRNE